MSILVLHIPHASTYIPAEVRKEILLSGTELSNELLRMTDRYTDLLVSGVDSVSRVVFPVSRLVVDPERFEDDQVESMARRGMGVIYTRASTGRPLRQTPSVSQREQLLNDYYRPHHAKLERVVAETLAHEGQCLIVDVHSYASTPLPHEPDQSPHRPDICIGTDAFHTPVELAESSVRWFAAQGLRVAVNRPFAGSLTPMAYFEREPRVMSIMVEINRKLYMDEETGAKSAEFESVRSLLSRWISHLQRPSLRQRNG